MLLELHSLRKAIASLEANVLIAQSRKFTKLSPAMQNVVRAGVIQNFEFTYELCWKFMKRYLADQLGSTSVEGTSRMELFRLSAENKLIEDVATWKTYHDYRNLTTHTYEEDIALEVFSAAITFVADAKKFLAALEAHND
jgi:nucleotidyltransferase substrate binding protein (TIGR01987 family)